MTQHYAPPAEELARDTWLFMEEVIDSLAEEGGECQGAPRRQLVRRLRALHDLVLDDPQAVLGGPPARARASVIVARLCDEAESVDAPQLSARQLAHMQRELHRAMFGSRPR